MYIHQYFYGLFRVFANCSLPELVNSHFYVERIHSQTTKHYKGLMTNPTLLPKQLPLYSPCPITSEIRLLSFPGIMYRRRPEARGTVYQNLKPPQGAAPQRKWRRPAGVGTGPQPPPPARAALAGKLRFDLRPAAALCPLSGAAPRSPGGWPRLPAGLLTAPSGSICPPPPPQPQHVAGTRRSPRLRLVPGRRSTPGEQPATGGARRSPAARGGTEGGKRAGVGDG